MNTFLHKLYTLIFLVLTLSSCAGVERTGTAGIMRDIKITNLDSGWFPWIPGLANGKTKRWDIEQDGLIPVKLNGSALAKEAIEEIEFAIQMPLFETSSIANLPDEQISRGIIVSEGTAIGPNGVVTKSTCGHVAAFPHVTNFPKDFYAADGRINTRLYVNLSSKKCSASLDIAIHEFGHALGLGNHFNGFGIREAISPVFWQVLYTLYHNKVGTSGQDLHIEAPGG